MLFDKIIFISMKRYYLKETFLHYVGIIEIDYLKILTYCIL